MKSTVKRLGCRVLLIVVGIIVIVLALTWLYSERIADRSILTDSPCAAPCWQGIVPGTLMETEEIVEILETLPYVGRVRQYSLPTGTEIRWRWKQWPWRRTGYNRVFLVEGVVHHITLSVEFKSTMEEILDKYGIPEVTIYGPPPLPEEPYMWMTLFYPTRGLQFRAEVLTRNEPVLEPTTRISEILYLVPADSLEDWLESNSDRSLQPWPDYGKLKPEF